MRRAWTFLPAAWAVCLCAVPVPADIVTTVVADADACISCQGYAGTDHGNHGADVQLRVGGPDNFRKSYLHFDLGGLDAGAEVVSAFLKADLQANSGGGSTIVFAIMDEDKDWDLSALPESGPGSITWYSAPQNDITGTGTDPGGNGIWPISYPDFLEEGTDAAAVTRRLGAAPADGHIDLDVSEPVKWLLGQQAAYSTFADSDRRITLCLRDVNVNGYHYTDYYSKEYTDTEDADAPRLVITQVPEPATMALMCLGAVVAFTRRRSSAR